MNYGKGLLEMIEEQAKVTTFAPLTGDDLKSVMIDLSAIPSSPSKSVEEYFETIRKTGVLLHESTGEYITKNPIVYGTGGEVPDPDGSIKAVFDEARLEAQRARLRELRLLVDFNWLVEEADIDDPDFLVDDIGEEERELLIGMIREEREKLNHIKEYPLTEDDMTPAYPGLTEEKLRSTMDDILLSGKGLTVTDPKSHFVMYGGANLMKEMDEYTRKAEEALWFGNDPEDKTKEGLIVTKSRGYGKSYLAGIDPYKPSADSESARKYKEASDERAKQKGKFSDFFRRNKR